MYYILYNPANTYKKGKKKIDKLFKKLSSVDECYKLNLSEINGKEIIFLKSLNAEDVVYMCGGDGSLNRFLNNIGKEKIKCKLLFYCCEMGNDFARDFKGETFINLEPIREFMPVCYINGEEKHYFVNGIGVGIDAVVSRSKIQQNLAGARSSYFKVALTSIKKFRPYTLDIEIDGEQKHYENVWLMVCNNGKYFGGGMKITPDAIRDDGEFELVIAHSLNKFQIILALLLVYFGLHKFVRGIEIIKCKKIKAIPDGCTIFQNDGESLDYAREIRVES